MSLALLSIAYIAILFAGERDDSLIANAFVNPNSKKQYNGY